MKTYQDGEIYFIRETEYPSGKLSPFVKIGLVRYKENRDSFGRLTEHQTGNPRRLELDTAHIVKTQAVDMVEAHLHRKYAKQRISGEWFEFKDDKSLLVAIKDAEALADTVSARLPDFIAAEELALKESNGSSREATAEEIELSKALAIAKAQMSACEKLSKQIVSFLTKAYSEGADISDTAKTTVKTYAPKFLDELFQEKEPKLWAEYQGEVKKWMHPFLNKYKLKDGELGLEFESEMQQNVEIFDKVTQGDEIGKLVEVNLSITNLNGLAEWEAKVAEAKLKLSIGLADEIKGVCTWKRYWHTKTAFDSNRLAADKPELAKKYVSTPETKEYVVPKKGKTQ